MTKFLHLIINPYFTIHFLWWKGDFFMSKKLFTASYYYEGKRYFVRSAKSQRDADRRADKAKAERAAGRIPINGDMPVGRYALHWAEVYKSATTSPTVYKAYIARINNHIIPEIGAMRLRDVKPTHLQAIMNKQAGQSKSHCDKLLLTLRAIFRQAYKDGATQRDYSEDIRAPKASAGTHRSITPAERAAVLDVADRHRFGLAVKLMLYCGLRPQEVIALKWSDIDQVNRRLMVQHALKKDGTIAETKTAAGKRMIPIPALLWDCLQFPDNLDGYVLTNTLGEHHTRTSFRRAWLLFRREVDIAMGAVIATDTAGNALSRYNVPVIVRSAIAPDLNMYCFRHTYCTDLEAAGVPINVAKYLMGHSSIQMTASIYTHMREDTLTDIAAKIDGLGATIGATIKHPKPVKISSFTANEENTKLPKTGTR